MNQPKPKQKYTPTKEDIAFSKRSGIPMSDIIAQGGVTPSSVIKEIKKTGGYISKYKGLSKIKKK